jgi:glycosyltransferase involved in cell wall biosynthesis
MISVLFLFRRNRAKWLREWQAGEGSSEFLYGMPYLDPEHFRAAYAEGHAVVKDWRQILCYPFEMLVSRRVGIGFGVHIAWMHWKKIRQADVVISTVDTVGLPLAMFKYMGLLKKPLIYINQGLGHRMEALSVEKTSNRVLRSAYARFLQSVDKILVLGRGAAQPLANLFALPPHQISVLPFGTDQEFWKPAGALTDNGYILSVGSDPARDYSTLLRALSGQKLHIVTRQKLPGELVHNSVLVGSRYSQMELRTLYQNAHLVVIPLKDTDQPSGQSATLQAMACSKAVILTRTKGLWEPEQMKHMETCYLVEPGSVNSLRQAISFFRSHPEEAKRIGENGRNLVESRYNSRLLAKNMEKYIREVVTSNED